MRFRTACLASALALCGCAQETREHLFSGRAVTHVALTPEDKRPAAAAQSSDELSVQGWVVHNAAGHSLSLTFSNQSAAVVPMSAVVDEYLAKTGDGRIFPLKDVDFINYPQQLSPGDERTVTLFLPKKLAAKDISQVIAKLDLGKVVVVLQSIGPKEPPAWRVGPSTGIVISDQARVVRMDATPTEKVPVPAVVEPVGLVAPRSEAPIGTVPVMVVFRQAFGSTLRAEVFWNDQKEHVILGSGDQQVFYVVPGQHEFHAICRLPFIMETRARVPVVVSATAPVRIELEAEAKLSGVVLRLQVYGGERRIIDQRFSPLSKH